MEPSISKFFCQSSIWSASNHDSSKFAQHLNFLAERDQGCSLFANRQLLIHRQKLDTLPNGIFNLACVHPSWLKSIFHIFQSPLLDNRSWYFSAAFCLSMILGNQRCLCLSKICWKRGNRIRSWSPFGLPQNSDKSDRWFQSSKSIFFVDQPC